MQHSDGGDFWNSRVDDVAIARWTAVTGGATLVRLRLTNESDELVAVRVVETVPESVTDASLIASTGDDRDSWRHDGDWIVHEFAIPAGGKRTAAYLLRSGDEPPLSLEPPNVEMVESVPEEAVADAKAPIRALDEPDDSTAEWAPLTGNGAGFEPAQMPTHANDDVATEETSSTGAGEGARDEDGQSTGEMLTTSEETAMDEYTLPRMADEQAPDEEHGSIVADFLEALEEDATPAQRRALRSELGASESERARLVHVQSRLDDLAAYIDALEEFLDDHGTEVVEDLRGEIEANASTVATLQDDLAAVEADLDSHRADFTETIETIETDVAAIQSQYDDRLAAVESALEATRSTLSDLEAKVQDDRHARAREVRRFDESLTEMEATIERLGESVRKSEAFRKRFTTAFTTDANATEDDAPGSQECDHASPSD